jgi:hypothetical protein
MVGSLGLWCLGGALSLKVGLVISAQGAPDYELAPINYSASKDHNAITKIQKAVDTGSLSLPDDTPRELLGALLDQLNIPVSSQVLVFSKTSLQHKIITPTNPRAIYFNDDFYVGYVPGGMIEVIACDDPKGMMFYSFDTNAVPEKRRFLRDQECMTCHASSNTMNIPGLLVRSVYTDQKGQPLLSWGSLLTTPASPIGQRWGGWYVSGNKAEVGHMGNQWVDDPERGMDSYHVLHNQHLRSLSGFFDTRIHLTDSSDILALMIMEHQIQVHNTLSAAKMRYLRSIYLDKAIHGNERSPSVERLVSECVQSVLKVLMFADELRLPEDGVEGADEYRDSFMRLAHRHDGHSLRDLRLEKRMFKYRCSFMIHSKSFEQLPDEIKIPVLAKLHAIVTDRESPAGLPLLSSREKERIHDILSHTHSGYQSVMLH